MRVRADYTIDHDAVFLPASTLRLSVTPGPAYVRIGEPQEQTLSSDYKIIQIRVTSHIVSGSGGGG